MKYDKKEQGATLAGLNTIRVVLATEPREYGKESNLLRVRSILSQPGGEGSLDVNPRNKTQLLPKFFKELRGVKDMPCCGYCSVAESTDPRIVASCGFVGEGDNDVGEAAEVTSADILGPGEEIFLPIHPPYAIVEPGAFVWAVPVDRAAGRTAGTAYVVARAMVVGCDSTHETPRKALHMLSDRFSMALSRLSVGLSSESSEQGGRGRFWGRSEAHIADNGVCWKGSRRGSVNRFGDEWVDTSLTDITQKGVGKLGTSQPTAIHDLGDAESSACCTRRYTLHFCSTSIFVLVRKGRWNAAVENSDEGLLTAPASSSSSLNKVVEAKR